MRNEEPLWLACCAFAGCKLQTHSGYGTLRYD
jgi:hypothetical protein